VGGNVQTSQRVVDVILRAFEAAAASQGCMNNLTFGDATVGYYETIAGGAGAVSSTIFQYLFAEKHADLYRRHSVCAYTAWTSHPFQRQKPYTYTKENEKQNLSAVSKPKCLALSNGGIAFAVSLLLCTGK
jgi:hypothetical protein